MNKAELAHLIFGACIAAAVLSIMPVLVYLFTGWKVRRDKLIAYMNEGAISVYYVQFPWTKVKEPDLTKRFTIQFDYLYGRRHFIPPLALFCTSVVGALWGIARTAQARFQVSPGGLGMSMVALAALLGAFLWSISDELDRVVRRDLAPKDVYSWAFRLLLSVPFGFAVSAALKEDVGMPVAFFLGAFPTQTLFTIARRIAVQKLSLGDQQGDARLELEQLQSISRSVAEKFQDNGVDTVSALAWADPVDLTIRTNLDFNYVLDCMSQALLWVYFEEHTRVLFKFSLRGAQEVTGVVKAIEGVEIPYVASQPLTPEQARAKATVRNVAEVLGISDAAFMSTLSQVAADPYTCFINRVWH